MSLFKKKKDKNEISAENAAGVDNNTDVTSSELDSLFTGEVDDDISKLLDDTDFSDDDLRSILDKYISEDDGSLLAALEEKPQTAAKTSVAVADDLDIAIGGEADDEPSFNSFDNAVFNITDSGADENVTETSEVAETVSAQSEVFLHGEPEAGAEPEEDRELTTDEAIEEFIKNVSLGGNIAELLKDTEHISEDGLEVPAFANAEEERGDAVPETPQVELAVPQDIEESDFNTAETDGVGSTDMNLRIAFGLEEEDDDSEEMKDAVKKMGDHFETDSRIGRKFKPEHPEFTDTTQARDIAAEYKTRKKNVSIRLFFALITVLILLVYENIPTITELVTGFPKQFAGVFDPAVYPVVYIMVSLQLLFITAIFALPELTRGVKRLFSAAPTPESMTVFALVVAAAASFIKAYFSDTTLIPTVYNAAAAMSVVMTLVYSRLNVKREMITFFIAGSKKKKYAMNRVPENETLIPPDSYEDDMYGDVMRVERTGFIDGFFARMSTPDGMTGAFTAALIGIAMAAAILFGVFSEKSANAVYDVAGVVYIVVLSLLPLSAHVTFSYPFYRASRAASEWDSAIVGETSLEEYAATAVVSFDDGNVFPSYGVKVQNIKIYNNARIDRVLYYASSTFKYAGGPLADVFEVATMEMGRSDNVQITDADRGYLAATVDGVNIVFGSYPSLIQKGFDIDDTVARDDVDFSDELSIMYMFREDMLIAKLYIKYVLDGDIEPILHQFQDYGMYLCVRTYDPNIDEDMICAKLQLKNPPVKVVRYRKADDVRGVMERVDSGFVTYGSPKSLLQLLPYCDKTIHTKRTCGALTIMAVIVSLMMLAVYSMSSGISSLNSLYITAYHTVWVFFTCIASKLFIR